MLGKTVGSGEYAKALEEANRSLIDAVKIDTALELQSNLRTICTALEVRAPHLPVLSDSNVPTTEGVADTLRKDARAEI